MRFVKYAMTVSLLIISVIAVNISRVEARPVIKDTFEFYYGDTTEALYPDSSNTCNILCHISVQRRLKNWYGDCLEYRTRVLSKTFDQAIAECNALDSDSDGWTTNEEVFATQGLGLPTLPGNNFAVAEGLTPDGTVESSDPPPTLQANFSDIDYGQVPPYMASIGNDGMDDQPGRVEWEIDIAGNDFTAPVATSGIVNIYSEVYSDSNPADKTFAWTPPELQEDTDYSWRVRFMEANVAGDTKEWGDWYYGFITTEGGPVCTDNDSDLYYAEEGCGTLVDCDDDDGSINPGAAELCDGVDNDCNDATADGYDEEWIFITCDGPDSDLCEEGSYGCVAGVPGCTDTTGDNVEVCDGVDNDCDSSTADGSGEAWYGTACDGADSDFCEEGSYSCIAGAPGCSDVTGDNVEICDRVDNDCDSSTADGSGEAWYGIACDGADSDICDEGAFICVTGSRSCSDDTGDDVEICGDTIDNDCDGTVNEGCLVCTDSDDDGYYAEAGCGTELDCEDKNEYINPGACDIKRDGIDQDCSGSDRRKGKPCPREGRGKTCSDGLDNDSDGRIDCDDTDCDRNKSCT